jgi:hypothetical protein
MAHPLFTVKPFFIRQFHAHNHETALRRGETLHGGTKFA